MTTADEPRSARQYSVDEVDAARRLNVAHRFRDGRGVIYFAGGYYWPDKLDADARKYEADAVAARVVAAALRRELASEAAIGAAAAYAAGGAPEYPATLDGLSVDGAE